MHALSRVKLVLLGLVLCVSARAEWTWGLSCPTPESSSALSGTFTATNGGFSGPGDCHRVNNFTKLVFTTSDTLLNATTFHAIHTGDVLIVPPVKTTETQPVFAVAAQCPTFTTATTLVWLFVQWDNVASVRLDSNVLVGKAIYNPSNAVQPITITGQYDITGATYFDGPVPMSGTCNVGTGVFDSFGPSQLDGKAYFTADGSGVYKTTPGRATFFFPSVTVNPATLGSKSYEGILFDSASATPTSSIRQMKVTSNAGGTVFTAQPYLSVDAGTLDGTGTGYVDTITVTSTNNPVNGILIANVSRSTGGTGRLVCIANPDYAKGARVMCSGESPNDNGTPYNITFFHNPGGLVARYDAATDFPGVGCTSSTLKDISGYENHGTLQNVSSCSGSSGWNGNGTTASPYRLTLDGVNDYVIVPGSASLDVAGPMTLEAWVQSTGAGTTRPLIEFNAGSGVNFWRGNSTFGQIWFNFVDSGGNPHFYWDEANMTAGNWYQMVVVYDGNSGIGYVNGRRITGYSFATITPMTNGDVYIGARLSGGYYFEGSIASISIYNRALSAGEVRRNCSALASRFSTLSCAPAGTVVELDARTVFPGASGCSPSAWTDSSGYGNDGTLSGFSSCGASSGWLGTGVPSDPYRLRFDGVNDIVTVTSSLSTSTGGGPLTFEAWLQALGSTAADPLIVYTGGPSLWRGNTVFSDVFADFTDDLSNPHSISGAGPFVTGNWYHVLATYDNAVMTYYVNGTPVKGDTFSIFRPNTSLNIEIGGRTAGGYHLTGALAYASIRSGGMSTTEVAERCNAMSTVVSGVTCPSTAVAKVAEYDASVAFPGTGCTSSTWSDLSGNGNHAALTNFTCGGGTGWNGNGTPASPYRLTYDGTNDRVTATKASSLDVKGPMSVEAWISPAGAATSEAIYSFDDTSRGVSLFRGNSSFGDLWTNFRAVGAVDHIISVPGVFSAGNWYHVVTVYDGSTQKIYVNGRQTVSEAVGFVVPDTAHDFNIGCRPNDGYYFTGSIAYAALYRGALTKADTWQKCQSLAPRFSGVTCAAW